MRARNLLGLVLLVAACGGTAPSGVPGTVTGPTTTTQTAATTSTSPVTTTTPSSTTTSSVLTTTSALPPAPLPDVPLLIAGPDGIELLSPGGTSPLLQGRSVDFAVPDGRGGIVFQGPGGNPWVGDPPAPIEWIRAVGDVPVVLVSGEGSYLQHLVQVVEVGGRASVLYRRWVVLPNDCAPADEECRWNYQLEQLVLRDLDGGGETVLGRVGSFESDYTGVTIGGEWAVISYLEYGGSEWCAGLTTLDGLLGRANPNLYIEPAPCAFGPGAICPEGHWCRGGMAEALSPDGAVLAYAYSYRQEPLTGQAPTPTQPTRVAMVDTTTGDELVQVEVAPPDVDPVWIDTDGRHAVVGLDPELMGTASSMVVVELSGAVTPLQVTGRATIWAAG